MSELVRAALLALGPGPSRYEVAKVARALRESADVETLAVFGLTSSEPDPDPAFDRAAAAAVAEIAARAGAGPFTALDLYTEVVNPGWSPFPRSEAVTTGE